MYDLFSAYLDVDAPPRGARRDVYDDAVPDAPHWIQLRHRRQVVVHRGPEHFPVSNHRPLALRSGLAVTPAAWMSQYTDYWGTAITAFEVHERHDDMSIVSTSTVNVTKSGMDAENFSWDQLQADDVGEGHTEFLTVTPSVDPGEDQWYMYRWR